MSKDKVIVCWIDTWELHTDNLIEAPQISTLAYNGGNGAIRVYDRDGVDPRVTFKRGTDEVFEDPKKAGDWMVLHAGHSCLVTVPCAVEMGFKRVNMDGRGR